MFKQDLKITIEEKNSSEKTVIRISKERLNFELIWGKDKNMTCWRCMTSYNCVSAEWVYNDVLKRKLIACPNCKCQVQVNR